MKTDLPKYVHRDDDRHGNERLYYIRLIPGTRKLFKRRLRSLPGTKEFRTEFDAAFRAWNRLYKPSQRRPVRWTTRGLIYFLRIGDRVKIGFTTSLDARIQALQIGSPDPFELLGSVPGIKAEEKDAHEIFARDRVAGEWFALTPELQEYIARKVGKSNFPGVEITCSSLERSRLPTDG